MLYSLRMPPSPEVVIIRLEAVSRRASATSKRALPTSLPKSREKNRLDARNRRSYHQQHTPNQLLTKQIPGADSDGSEGGRSASEGASREESLGQDASPSFYRRIVCFSPDNRGKDSFAAGEARKIAAKIGKSQRLTRAWARRCERCEQGVKRPEQRGQKRQQGSNRVDKTVSEHTERSPFIGDHKRQNTLRIWQQFCRSGVCGSSRSESGCEENRSRTAR
jgi:hypothetical protein